MTETDATKLPLTMPEKYIPYLDKYRIYRAFWDLLHELVVTLPRDHVKQTKIFMTRHTHCSGDIENLMVLVSDELNIDAKKLVKELIKDLGFFVITRRCVMDRYESHDDYEPGCVSPELLSKVTKAITIREPVQTVGWLMYDHPCTVREARCLQQDGVLPTVTLYITTPPPVAPPAPNAATASRSFWKQDIEGLKWAYQATLKEVWIEPDQVDDIEKIASKCFNAMRACCAGLQGPGQGIHAMGTPSYYRVLMIGPRCSGRNTHSKLLAKHFNLVHLVFSDMFAEARERNDEVGQKLRNFGCSFQLKAEIVRRRIIQKDCLDNGWVLTGYPTSGVDFEQLDNMETPPNRILFLNVDWAVCKARAMAKASHWQRHSSAGLPGLSGRCRHATTHPDDTESMINNDLETYFSETLAELRAAAGITAVEINEDTDSVDEVQTRIQAAVITVPAFDIVNASQIRNVRVD